MTLEERLKAEGIILGCSNPERGSKEWALNGTVLGSFDAHEGWAILKRRDMEETWPLMLKALRAAKEYMEFRSEPGMEPYPLQEVRVAIWKASGEIDE